MIKRLGMSLIWFYAGWYAGAMAAFFGGFTPLVGPLVGVLAAAFYIGDTRGMWGVRRRRRTPPRPRRRTPCPARSTVNAGRGSRGPAHDRPAQGSSADSAGSHTVNDAPSPPLDARVERQVAAHRPAQLARDVEARARCPRRRSPSRRARIGRTGAPGPRRSTPGPPSVIVSGSARSPRRPGRIAPRSASRRRT